MQTISALVIDNNAGLMLIQSAVDDGEIPIKIIPLNRLKDAETFLTLAKELPDILIVSSDVIIHEGCERLLHLMHEEKLKSIRLFVLTEFIGEEKHLIRGGSLEAYFIAMPYSYSETEIIIRKIYESYIELFHKEGELKRQID